MKGMKWFLAAAMLVGSLGVLVPANAETTIIDTGSSAVLTNDLCGVNTCPTQVIYEQKRQMCAPVVLQQSAPACPSSMVIERDRSHFLRFGLGPLLDFGLF
jgi:hypothetical protein